MTFTIAARCMRSGEAGMAMATVSLAVGGLCPWFTSGGDIISSQAFASKGDGDLMFRAIEAGKTACEAIDVAKVRDLDIDYRQLLILRRDGEMSAFSGVNCRPWSGHLIGADFIVAGNVLAGEHVIQSMAEAFRSSDQYDLGERLLLALEAGRDMGGQATPDGIPIAERSASLCVLGSCEDRAMRLIDLRVDMHNSAVHEMRRLFEINKVYAAYSVSRDLRPSETPSILAFEAEALQKGGVFASRPSCFR